MQEASFQSSDGLKIVYRSWQPEGQPRAVIVINHGFNAHGGQQAWAAEQFTRAGFAVFALDMRGLPATEALHIIERYTRPTIGRIAIEVTIDDPKAYTRPWKVNLNWTLLPDTDLIESICEENNKAEHLPTVAQ